MTLGLFCRADAQAAEPGFMWVKPTSTSGPSCEYHCGRVATDNAGNSFITGKFADSLTLGTNVLTGSGFFIGRYNADGAVVWARRVGPSTFGDATLSDEWGPRVAADNLGGVVLLARLGSAEFGTTNISNGGGENFVLARYLADGTLAWARSAAPNTWGGALAVDGSGNSFVTGLCGSDSFGTTNFSGTGTQGVFLAKFDLNGNALWIKGAASQSLSFYMPPKGIAVAESGDIVVCGQFGGPLNFGATTLTNAGMWDVYIARFDVDGDLLWAKRGGSTNRESALGVGVDRDGNAYFAGAINDEGGTVLHPSTAFDGYTLNDLHHYLVKYSATGEVLWARESAAFDYLVFGALGGVDGFTIDRAGNSYLLGRFIGTATFGSLSVTNPGGSDWLPDTYASSFLVSYDSNGNASWVKRFGGSHTVGWADLVGGLASDAHGRIAISGDIAITNAVFDAWSFGKTFCTDVFMARLDADRPNLNLTHVGTALTLSWPTNYTGYTLEYSDDAGAGSWSAETNSVAVSAPNFEVNASAESAHKFYRLRKP